jgi:hypothetical protein
MLVESWTRGFLIARMSDAFGTWHQNRKKSVHSNTNVPGRTVRRGLCRVSAFPDQLARLLLRFREEC